MGEFGNFEKDIWRGKKYTLQQKALREGRKVDRKSDHEIGMENGRPNKEGAHISKHERERIGN